MKLFHYPFRAMGSPCELQLYAAQQGEADTVAQLCIAEVVRLEAKYSRYHTDNLMHELNCAAPAGAAVHVDQETAQLFHFADTCYRVSDGLFDITAGVLRAVWHKGRTHLPDAEDIHPLLARVGWQRVQWQAPVITFAPGMEIDFGGIVKEYAADRLAALCQSAGMHHGIINLGGDIRVIGPHADGTPWQIGIQHPREPWQSLGTLSLSHGAIATSGDYARCLVVNGRRYSHILNPQSGWPVQYLASVTVLAELCVVAGSASTIAMLMEHAGQIWLEQLGVSHVWEDMHGTMGGTLKI